MLHCRQVLTWVGVVVAGSIDLPKSLAGRFARWLLEARVERRRGPHEQKDQVRQHPWWQVTCLTGVDYFSTLGYLPSIAIVAASALSPVATLLIVLLSLLGMLPMYRRVAESPYGQGSIAMLERLLSWWKGKIFVLCLLGFIATDFIVTITLSSSDAAAHITENPFVEEFLGGQEIVITLVLVAILGTIFLKGFREAVGIAVFVVGTYLLLNLVVVGVALYESVTNPWYVANWADALLTSHGDLLAMIGVALVVFPQLALGVSGFETGVTVMPFVRGDDSDTQEYPASRVHNTGKLLMAAALIMSFFLITTSFVTAVLIPPRSSKWAARPRIGRSLTWRMGTLDTPSAPPTT